MDPMGPQIEADKKSEVSLTGKLKAANVAINHCKGKQLMCTWQAG